MNAPTFEEWLKDLKSKYNIDWDSMDKHVISDLRTLYEEDVLNDSTEFIKFIN